MIQNLFNAIRERSVFIRVMMEKVAEADEIH